MSDKKSFLGGLLGDCDESLLFFFLLLVVLFQGPLCGCFNDDSLLFFFLLLVVLFCYPYLGGIGGC